MDSQLMDIFGAVMQAVIVAAVPVLVGLLANWLLPKAKQAWAELNELAPEQMEVILMLARVAVQAAEQAGLNGWTTDKKKWALKLAQQWVDEKGIKVSVELISSAIEASVFEEFNSWLADPKQLKDCVE